MYLLSARSRRFCWWPLFLIACYPRRVRRCHEGDILVLSLAQVMDWIENHGEAFLSKHTGVGKSLHRARALQKRHDDFEDVAQVSPGSVEYCDMAELNDNNCLRPHTCCFLNSSA